MKTVDEIFVILISELADVFGLISFIIFLVSRFACDIAIIAAGTRPPMNMPRLQVYHVSFQENAKENSSQVEQHIQEFP
ncbi:MAG: hypothetical protein WCF23_19360 [Candidatus Nitrosopolaris sp.]